MTTDPYRVLGVVPSADEVAIRAAYRKLMKRFHPDRNRSADAAERGREVAAAYALLSDPEQRGRFDRERQYRQQVIAPAPPPPPRRAPRGRLGGLLLVVLSLAITAFALIRFTPDLKRPSSPSPPSREVAAARPEIAPDHFRPVDPSAPSPSELTEIRPPPPPVRLPSPANEPALPAPRLAAAPPRQLAQDLRPLPASATQPLVDRAATLARPPSSTPGSDDCAAAATCAGIDLAALERMQSLLDRQSYEYAPAAKQARLLATRAAFLSRLGRCASAACKRDAYLARNRELAELMRS